MHKVLVIEDEPLLRENIVELFESHSYDVVSAENGSEGYDVAVRMNPDLIVSDVIMPEQDGFALIQRLKKNPTTELTPVIFLTAKTMLEAKLEGLTLGADDYIMKPFSSEELLVRSFNLITKRKKMLNRSLVTPSTEDIRPKSELLIRDIVNIIEANITNYNLSVDMIAAELGISKSTIQRKLKTAIDKNLNQLIREYRLEKARKMIERESGNLSDIAQATGFNSLSYFSYSYKQFYGVPPSRQGGD